MRTGKLYISSLFLGKSRLTVARMASEPGETEKKNVMRRDGVRVKGEGCK